MSRQQVSITFREQAIIKGYTLFSYFLIRWLHFEEFKEDIFQSVYCSDQDAFAGNSYGVWARTPGAK